MKVDIAIADALRQMGAKGSGDMDLGDKVVGINMGAMMANIAIGGAVGQNITER